LDDGRFLEIGPLSYGLAGKTRPSYLEPTGAEQSGQMTVGDVLKGTFNPLLNSPAGKNINHPKKMKNKMTSRQYVQLSQTSLSKNLEDEEIDNEMMTKDSEKGNGRDESLIRGLKPNVHTGLTREILGN